MCSLSICNMHVLHWNPLLLSQRDIPSKSIWGFSISKPLEKLTMCAMPTSLPFCLKRHEIQHNPPLFENSSVLCSAVVRDRRDLFSSAMLIVALREMLIWTAKYIRPSFPTYCIWIYLHSCQAHCSMAADDPEPRAVLLWSTCPLEKAGSFARGTCT